MISYNFFDDFLIYILILPLITIFIIYLCSFFCERKILLSIVLWFSAFSFILSIILLLILDKTDNNFQYQFALNIIPNMKYDLVFGVDGISIYFIIMTNLFMYLCFLNVSYKDNKMIFMLIILLFLQWGVLCTFTVLDILGFFIFFESTLIPIFLLVLIWGSRSRRIRAGYLISIYTLFGSIFMFFNIIYIYSKLNTTDYQFLFDIIFSKEDQYFMWLFFMIAFAAKIPMFPLHIWLPEAHVEAPTIGSVLLAVLLLKLGTYGFIRFSLCLCSQGTIFYKSYIEIFAICAIIYTSLTAIRQIDLKKIIAYSSVGHMNVVLLGLLSLYIESLEGSIFQMISHGVVSGALFFGVGVLYDRYKIRSLKYFGGFATLYPLLALITLIFFMANISFPGTSSFVGEFLILSGVFHDSFIITFIASLSMILGAVYTLWTYNRIFFGNIKIIYIKSFNDLSKKEFYLFLLLLLFLFFMGFFPYIILNNFHINCLNILEKVRR